MARAFNAAWNAHDVAGVVAFFAPGATIRQTPARAVVGDADGGPDPPEAEDTYGAGRRSRAAAQDARGWSRGEVLWAAGPPRIRAWLPWFFAAGHRVEASAYHAAGNTVTWRYRAFAAPYRALAGVEPVEGTAELVVQAGRIASFTFATEGEAITRRARQFEAVLNARFVAAHAVRRPDGPRPRRPEAPAPLPADPLLLLGLFGAAALAGVGGARRRPHRGGWAMRSSATSGVLGSVRSCAASATCLPSWGRRRRERGGAGARVPGRDGAPVDRSDVGGAADGVVGCAVASPHVVGGLAYEGWTAPSIG